ncbi:MAG: hypothetical protein QF463_01300 [Vicinamibacterales bacterium]|jgi:hypothetical protein|nr:hypothetical protein [Acidobacteriota bacterium]MDP6371168.1 hypothetical protein [Vicinamibacterales bacterium]MDP6607684.1 hypothetical protein [Vicinamibacterales bacterium]HAK54163.1 hypothetical protein [Acidobacteriota bacterium]|tara:strand:+ start:3889 stop:4173 length:285 start_codon:yes stop_codon:yes gene_type:complete
MQDIPVDVLSNLPVVLTVLLLVIAALVVYLTLMVRVIIDMLRHDVHGVLLTFAFLSLIPFPLILVLGIMVLTESTQIHVVQNWFEELKARVPVP